MVPVGVLLLGFAGVQIGERLKEAACPEPLQDGSDISEGGAVRGFVFVSSAGRHEIVDLWRGTSRRVALRGFQGVGFQAFVVAEREISPFLLRDSGLVVVKDAKAYAIKWSRDEPAVLAAADAVFPSFHSNRVWVVSQGARSTRQTAQEVDLDGETPIVRTELPDRFALVGALRSGLVVLEPRERHEPVLRFWNPATDELSLELEGVLVDAAGDLIAWLGGQRPTLHIRNMNARDQTVPAPRGRSYTAMGRLSPTGRHLAMVVTSKGDRHCQALAVVDTTSLAPILVERSGGTTDRFGWDPSGQWLWFVASDREESRFVLNAHVIGRRTTYRIVERSGKHPTAVVGLHESAKNGLMR